MHHRAARPSYVPLVLLAFLSACGDDDGTGPSEQVPTTVEIANAPLSFDLAGQTEQLDVTVLDQDGQAIANPGLTFTASDEDPDAESAAGQVAAVSSTGLVTALGNGTSQIEVRAGSVTETIDVAVDVTPTALTAGAPVENLSAPEGGQLFFTLEVPAGNEGTQILQVRLLGGTGDADLAVRFGTRPDLDTVDCFSAGLPNQLDNIELCVVADPEPGTWHFMVLAWEAFTDVDLQVDVKQWTELTSGVAETGLSADLFDVLYFRLDLQSGESLDLSTSGGTGDVDLFATPMETYSVLDFSELACISGQDGNEESCTVTATADETWTVLLFAFQAFDGVALTPNVTEAALAGSRRATLPGTYRGGSIVGGR